MTGEARAGPPTTASLRHLLGRLQAVEGGIRAAVATRRAEARADDDDRFRGLYIDEQEVNRLLGDRPPQPVVPPMVATLRARAEAEADAAEQSGEHVRLRRLAAAFGLDGRDEELLLVAVAPDLDPRFERLYAYLHDDVSRRRPSCGLALELAGLRATCDRDRLLPAGPLAAGGLLLVEEADRPFLTRPLRVPDRVVAHLVGDDTPDPAMASVLTTGAEADVDIDGDGSLVEPLRAGQLLYYLRERGRSAGPALARRIATMAGLGTVTVNLERVEKGDDVRALAAVAIREARLRGAALVVSPVEAIIGRGAAAVRAFAEAACPVIVVGTRPWNPEWSRRPPVLVDVPVLTAGQRQGGWLRALNGQRPLDFDPAAVTIQFHLAPDQVQAAASVAILRAAAAGRPLSADDVVAGARAQNGAGLERLARRIEPRSTWDDLVLPAHVLGELRELVARVRRRERVLDEWGLGGRSTRGRGITALLAGPSGTGKTMSAEVVGAELGLDLYVIDLSTVVDKYVGETEKNLDRIFSEAERVNGVLFFDEADAIFGKRSEVRDARDRWANIEVSYLLQRMEQFDGIVLLSTNMRSNVDEAFTRRLDAVVEFPIPDEGNRLRLWEKNLRPGIPRADDLDIEFLAHSFKLSGGNIANIVLTGAFLAAEAGTPLGMPDLIRATQREYRKLGRLCVEAEFCRYYPLVAAPHRQ